MLSVGTEGTPPRLLFEHPVFRHSKKTTCHTLCLLRSLFPHHGSCHFVFFVFSRFSILWKNRKSREKSKNNKKQNITHHVCSEGHSCIYGSCHFVFCFFVFLRVLLFWGYTKNNPRNPSTNKMLHTEAPSYIHGSCHFVLFVFVGFLVVFACLGRKIKNIETRTQKQHGMKWSKKQELTCNPLLVYAYEKNSGNH